MTATAASLISLVIIRFLFGVSEAALSPLIASAFRRGVTAARSSSAFGFFLAGGRLGGMIAPFIAARCVVRYGWRSAFFAFAAIGIVVFAGWFAAFPRTIISRSPQLAPPAPPPRFSAPLLALISTALLYTMAWQFFATWFPTYLIDVRHLSLQSAGEYAGLPFFFGLCATAFGGLFGDAVIGHLGTSLGRRLVCFTGLLVAALLFYCGSIIANPKTGAVLLSLAAGAGDFILGTLWASSVDLGGKSAGAISGLMNSAANAGAFLSPVVIGALLSRHFGWIMILQLMALLCAAAACLSLLVRIPSVSVRSSIPENRSRAPQ
ncbi:MAG: MFS transporter [Bryobacteraceae bacterium]